MAFFCSGINHPRPKERGWFYDTMGMQPAQTPRRLNPATLFGEIARTAFTRLWSGLFFLLNFQPGDIKNHNADVFRHSMQAP
jgi:hypothetical protein